MGGFLSFVASAMVSIEFVQLCTQKANLGRGWFKPDEPFVLIRCRFFVGIGTAGFTFTSAICDQLVWRQIISRIGQVLRNSASVPNFCHFLNFFLRFGSGPEAAIGPIASDGGTPAVPSGLFIWSRP